MRSLMLLVGCTGSPEPAFGLPTVRTTLAGTYDGAEPDGGFGASVAAGAGRVVVGAPHGAQGQVFELRDGSVRPLLEGDGRLGSSVAVTPAGVVAGAPLAGVVVGEDGQVLVEAAGAGLSLAADGNRWVAAMGEGWVSATETRTGFARPSSVAVAAGRVALGVPLGEVFVALDDGGLSRPEKSDEAGYAIAAGDVDGDGVSEWVVGAPGSRRVYVLADDGRPKSLLEDSRPRFGHAVAVGDLDGDGVAEILVGAPLANGRAGWAGLYVGGQLVDQWTSSAPGSRLGWSVAILPDHVVLGAPGAPGTVGRVRVLRVESGAG